MCSLSDDGKSCCTPLCLQRRKDAAVKSWYYAPTGTPGILDEKNGKYLRYRRSFSTSDGHESAPTVASPSFADDECVDQNRPDSNAKHICILASKPLLSRQLSRLRQDAVRPKCEQSPNNGLLARRCDARRSFAKSKTDGGKWLRGRRAKLAPLMGTVNVRLKRSPGENLGLGIAGGSDRSYPPTVSFLRPGYIAHRCDQLQIGEQLTHVNDINVEDLTHNEVLSVLRNAGNEVHLQVEYDLNQPCFVWPPNSMRKCTDISLERDQDGFGLTLRGGAYGPDKNKSRPIAITNIRIGGPAHKEGRLRVGDRILCINGVDVFSATLAVAQKLIDETLHLLTLTVEYSVAVFENLHKESGSLIVELEKRPEVDFGMKLKAETQKLGPIPKRVILVDSIAAASTADRCGFLQVGDQIVSLDGICLENTTISHAMEILKSSVPTLRIELVPISELRNSKHETKRSKIFSGSSDSKPISSAFSRKGSFSGHKPVQSPEVSSSSAATLESGYTREMRFRNGAQPRAKSHDRAAPDQPDSSQQGLDYSILNLHQQRFAAKAAISGSVPNMNQILTEKSSALVLARSVMSRSYYTPSNEEDITLAAKSNLSRINSPIRRSCRSSSMHGSLTTVPNGEICHTETMEVVLHSYAKGVYGLSLNKQQNLRLGDDQPRPLFISYIEKGSPAERSGVLQVGDRILAINDWCTANACVEEASKRIRQSTSPLTLTVEFDVIESVIPSNGILNVKLAKRGNNLGIVVRCETDGRKGEPVIISDIRTGSVAHRCGSIQIGDRVLAIDNIPLTSCTVEEAMRLLKRSGEVVKLRIRKTCSPTPEELDSLQKVVYSIELNRKGRPVGITIASRGEAGDPVIISQLAPNGLAERTGAFRVGDQILAINGESIEGKKVSDAIRLLQQNADLVTIKISRVLEPATATYAAFYNSGGMHNSQRSRNSRTTVPSDSFSETSDKMGTPIQSIDSAVESLEESPVGQQRASSVTHRISAQEQTLKYRSGDDHVDWRTTHDYVNNNTSLKSPISTYMQHPNDNLNNTSFHTGLQAPDAYGWDSGLSSTTDNNPAECCLCQKASTSDSEDWVKILEALETVGEAEMLQKLEDSIMGGNVPMCKHSHNTATASQASTSVAQSPVSATAQFPSIPNRQQWQPFAPSAANTILRQPPVNNSRFSKSNVPHPLTQIRDVLSSEKVEVISVNSNESGSFGGNVPPSMPPPKPPRYDTGEIVTVLDSFKHTFETDLTIPYITSPLPDQMRNGSQSLALKTLMLHELCPKVQSSVSTVKRRGTTHRVTLHKDPKTDSFGFSISDGIGENVGVYINAIMPDGPADKSGNIFPFDRILQVNDTSLEYLDCDIAVPLLNVDKIDLVLYREMSIAGSNRNNENGTRSFTNSISQALKDSSV